MEVIAFPCQPIFNSLNALIMCGLILGLRNMCEKTSELQPSFLPLGRPNRAWIEKKGRGWPENPPVQVKREKACLSWGAFRSLTGGEFSYKLRNGRNP